MTAITWEEAALVVGKIRTFHQPQDVGDATINAWQEALTYAGVTSGRDAVEAVIRHYTTPGADKWVTPADIVAGVRRIRQERLDHVDGIVPVTDPDDVAGHLAELHAIRAAVADGRILAPFPESKAVEGPVAGWLRPAISGAFRRPPRVNPAIEGRERPAKAAPARTIGRHDAERQEAERARQLAALEAITPRGETGSEVAS